MDSSEKRHVGMHDDETREPLVLFGRKSAVKFKATLLITHTKQIWTQIWLVWPRAKVKTPYKTLTLTSHTFFCSRTLTLWPWHSGTGIS